MATHLACEKCPVEGCDEIKTIGGLVIHLKRKHGIVQKAGVVRLGAKG